MRHLGVPARWTAAAATPPTRRLGRMVAAATPPPRHPDQTAVAATPPEAAPPESEGVKMSSARGNNKDAFINPYELQKIAKCARNQKMMDSLNITSMKTIMQPIQPRKRTKKTQGTSEAAPNNHNLRRRPERTSSEIAIANEQITDVPNCETIGNFLSDNEVADMDSNTKKKRKGRGISRMEDILLRAPGMPKIKIELNEFGQPIGENSRKLSSVIGIQLWKILPVGYADWRLVDAAKKIELWDDIKKRYDIDDAALD